MPDGMTLARATLDDILAHARATHPEECCGVVIAKDGREIVRRFVNVQTELHGRDPASYPRDGRAAYTTSSGTSTKSRRASSQRKARASPGVRASDTTR